MDYQKISIVLFSIATIEFLLLGAVVVYSLMMARENNKISSTVEKHLRSGDLKRVTIHVDSLPIELNKQEIVDLFCTMPVSIICKFDFLLQEIKNRIQRENS